MYDLGSIMEKVTSPAVSTEAKTILEALLMFERFYECNEMFDLYTHGIGPGIVGVVIHKLIDYLGSVVREKLTHDKRVIVQVPPLCSYVMKLKAVVNTVVVDEVLDATGRLKKTDEVKRSSSDNTKATEAVKQKKRPNIKHTERKKDHVTSSVQASSVQDPIEVDESDDSSDESSSGGSCSSNEKEFTTLTGPKGMAYKPPSTKLKVSRYSGKKEQQSSIENMEKQLTTLKTVFKARETEVARLRRENKQALERIELMNKDKDKLKDNLHEDYSHHSSDNKKRKKKEQRPLVYKGFVATQIAKDLDSDDEIAEVEIEPSQIPPSQVPDSTIRSRRTSDNAPSETGSCAPRKKRKRQHSSATVNSEVSSIKLVKQRSSHRIESDSQDGSGSSDSETEIKTLHRQKDELAERYEKLEAKLLEQRMDNRSRSFQDEISEAVRDLRSAMFSACGEDLDQNEGVCVARQQLDAASKTQQSCGYKFCVCDEFRERIERCINSGQVPEKLMRCSKVDNSCDDPIRGPIIDVVYEVVMPTVVKVEKVEDEDEDLQFIGLTPARRLPLQPLELKDDGKVVRPEKGDDKHKEKESAPGESPTKETSSDNTKPEVAREDKNTAVSSQDGTAEDQSENKGNDVPDNAQVAAAESEVGSDAEVDVVASQTPNKSKKKRPSDSDNKPDSDDETSSQSKKTRKAKTVVPTAMNLRNRTGK